MFWDAHILAGGQARRLGRQDKGALVVGDRRILDRQVAALGGRAARIVIVGGPERHIGGVEVIPDRLPGIGALGGLYTALVSATSDRTLVLACDMPYVTGPFLEFLATTGGDCDATVPRDRKGLHPLCAVYARSAAPAIRRAIDRGIRRVREAIGPLRMHLIESATLEAFDPEGLLLTNINTPDDYSRVARG